MAVGSVPGGGIVIPTLGDSVHLQIWTTTMYTGRYLSTCTLLQVEVGRGEGPQNASGLGVPFLPNLCPRQVVVLFAR